MLEPSVAFTLFDKILAAIGLLREGKKERTEKTDQALMALYAALSETKVYIREQKEGAPRDIDKEISLAGLWRNASIPLRAIDAEFAEKCFSKGSYWLEPDVWDRQKIEEKGIAIDAVFEATRALLIR